MVLVSAGALTLVSAGWGSAFAPFRPVTAGAFGSRDLWVLGSGELLRSTDAGRRFTRVTAPPLPVQGPAPTLVFADARDGYAYVRYAATPLYATHDGGNSWREVLSRVGTFGVGGGHAYAVTGLGLERSPVGRDAWKPLSRPVGASDASIAARGARLWLLGPPRRGRDSATLAYSLNSGDSFATRTGPCLFDLPGRLVPAGGNVVWAVCPGGMSATVYLSTDGGRSFPLIRSYHDRGGSRLPLLTNAAQIFPSSPRAAILCTGAQGPLLRTTDDGAHWRRLSQTARFRQILWLAFPTRRDGLVLGQTSAGATKLWRTTDSGATWRAVPVS